MKAVARRLLELSLAISMSLLALPARAADTKKPELLVFAAASLTDVLGELSRDYSTRGGARVRLSFAASSMLARQVEAGGKADVFVSADQEWMDYLQSRGLIQRPTRRDLVGNRLVLIARADSTLRLRIAPGFPLRAALGTGRLSTADPDNVPVGRYARDALVSLGVWDRLQDRLVRAENVRSAMMFVARGEAPLGIVYYTDALMDTEVRIVDIFPDGTHAPITYPAAAMSGASPEAIAYLNFLASAQVSHTWKKFGFLELER